MQENVDGKPDLTGLRERIQAVEENTDRLRWMLGLAGFELLAAGLGLAVLFWVRPLQFWLILAATVAGGLAGYLLRHPLTAGYRWLQHRRLRRDLAALTPGQREALFVLLEDDPRPDTRRLMASLPDGKRESSGRRRT